MELCGALKEWSEEERSEGRREGKMSVLIEFVKEGYISATEAARRAGLKEEEFRQKMDEASHFIS